MRLLSILCIWSTLRLSCFAQLSIRDEILQEQDGWIQPGSKRFHGEEPVEKDTSPPCEQPEEIEELRKNLKVSQKQLANCDKRLRGLQLGADLTENGKLDANSVYLRKIVEAMLNRFEGGIIAKEGISTQLRLSFSGMQRSEMRNIVKSMDRNNAPQLIEKIEKIISQAEVSYDNEKRSHFRQLYHDLCVILGEIDLFSAIQISIVVCAVVFVYIAATCRSRLVTMSYLVLFGMWISYFWHWQNMLRKSKVSRLLLSQKNPCEDFRSFYNPMRFFGTNSEECEDHVRKMFTPIFWEFTPIEVLCDMVATYTSKIVSQLIVNIMGAIGDAMRDFADKQSWFSVGPAFATLLIILLIILFKISGCGISLLHGAVRVGPAAEAPRSERSYPATTYEYPDRYLDARTGSPSRKIKWKEDRSRKDKRRRHKQVRGTESDSDSYLTAGEL